MNHNEVPVPFRYDWEVMAPTGFLLERLKEKWGHLSTLEELMKDPSMHAIVQRGDGTLRDILEHGIVRTPGYPDSSADPTQYSHAHALAVSMIAARNGEKISYEGCTPGRVQEAFAAQIRWLIKKTTPVSEE